MNTDQRKGGISSNKLYKIFNNELFLTKDYCEDILEQMNPIKINGKHIEYNCTAELDWGWWCLSILLNGCTERQS